LKGGGGLKVQKGVLGPEKKIVEIGRKYGRWAFLKGGGGQKLQKGVLGPEKKISSKLLIRENDGMGGGDTGDQNSCFQNLPR